MNRARLWSLGIFSRELFDPSFGFRAEPAEHSNTKPWHLKYPHMGSNYMAVSENLVHLLLGSGSIAGCQRNIQNVDNVTWSYLLRNSLSVYQLPWTLRCPPQTHLDVAKVVKQHGSLWHGANHKLHVDRFWFWQRSQLDEKTMDLIDFDRVW